MNRLFDIAKRNYSGTWETLDAKDVQWLIDELKSALQENDRLHGVLVKAAVNETKSEPFRPPRATKETK